MGTLGLILRWIAAVAAGIIMFVIGLALTALLLVKINAASANSYLWAVAGATLMGGLTGLWIAPQAQRQFARLVFSAGPVAVIVALTAADLLRHNGTVQNVMEVLGALQGGVIIWMASRSQGVGVGSPIDG